MQKASISRLLLAGVAALALMSATAKAEDGDLTVFDWSGYEDPAFHPDYVEKHGDSPTFAFFGDVALPQFDGFGAVAQPHV